MSEQAAVTEIQGKKAAEAAAAKAKAAAGTQAKLPEGDLYAVLFLLLLNAMEVRQSTVLTQSKMIEANSQAQERLNRENGEIKFSIIPKGAKTPTINRVQTENEEYAAIRENIQNELITTRQKGQVEMTEASTNVNILEQDSSENSAWLKTLNIIFKGLDQMTQRG